MMENLLSQRPRMKRCSVFCLSVLHYFVGMLMYSFKVYGTAIEKRFGLTSTLVGAITSCPEVGYLFATIPAAVFASKYSRPKIMAVGCLFTSLGSVIFCLPHVICGPNIEREKYPNVEDYKEKLCLTTISETSPTLNRSDPFSSERDSDDICRPYMYFFLGAILVGVGVSPVVTLQFSYIDDYAEPSKAPIYLGLVQSSSIVGIISTYFLEGLISKLYLRLHFGPGQHTDDNTRDNGDEWIGCWWIGFAIAAGGCLIFSWPLWRMKDEHKRDSFHEEETNDCTSHESVFIKIKRVLLNFTILPSLLAVICWHFQPIINGTFIMKYMQQEFQFSVSSSSIVVGVITCVPAIIGIPLGGFMASHFERDMRQISVFLLLVTGFGCFIIPSGCPSVSLVGKTTTGEMPCAKHCYCDRIIDIYPVCGDDGRTYATPCHAGCTEFSTDENHVVTFQGCYCVGQVHAAPEKFSNFSSVPGICKNRCEPHNSAIYMANLFLRAFALSTSYIPFGMFFMRNVHVHDKAIVIALREIFGKLVGEMSGTVVLGKIFDFSCKFSSSKTSSCLLYDLDALKQRYFLLNLLPSLVGVMLVSITVIRQRRMYNRRAGLVAECYMSDPD